MTLLDKLSIRSFLIGVVGLLAAVLVLETFKDFANTYYEQKEIARLGNANELSDRLLDASGFEAKERGVTSMALSSGVPADPDVLHNIAESRAKGDDAYKKALELAERLASGQGSNPILATAIKRSNSSLANLVAARKEADQSLSMSVKPYPAPDWIRTITAFIDANTELRLSAFSSGSEAGANQDALRLNVELKQAVWLVSEYAGRERAALGALIGLKKPIDAATRERLNSYRVIVELNLKTILQLKDAPGTDPAIITAIARMEALFLGSFNEMRKAVYDAGAEGAYPVSGKEWIERSSEAIQSIIDVSTAVGRMVENRVSSDMRSSMHRMLTSVAIFVFAVALSVAAIAFIRKKVINPIRYMSDALEKMEHTGDLTLSIKVSSGDESGRMAGAFNRMAEKFHSIIQELHGTIDLLASSAEELSASSGQIANESKSQGDRASQVSTSTHEMSATLTEVAKNVVDAAEAARVASRVAEKGGEAVTATIASMNGIAGNAKESKNIIAALGEKSRDIGNIIGVINDIADQTNLLALNAAIEAARAGEQGRGFAVVADEVRKLAEKTMKATKEIGVMIKDMQGETERAVATTAGEVRAVENGVELAAKAGEALQEIVARVETVTMMMEQITASTEEQTAATDQITHDIEAVAGLISETATSASQIARTSEEIAELATGLKGVVRTFKIAGTEHVNEIHIKGHGLDRIPPLPTGRLEVMD